MALFQKIFRHLVLAAITVVAGLVFSHLAGAAALKLEVDHLRSAKGVVRVSLFTEKQAKAFPRDNPNDKTVAKYVLQIEGNKAFLEVKDLAPGIYAIALYHDANLNNKLDQGPFGIPQEDYGFSNDAKEPLGPPRFKKAQFEIKDDQENSQVINIVAHP